MPSSLWAKLVFVIAIAGFSLESIAQDPQFTQFYANPLYLNPAFAGTQRCPRLTMNYRNQWPGISGQFVTYSASYDQHIDAIAGGVGVLVWNDQAGQGTLKTTNVSLMYSYDRPINRHFSIRAGFQAAYFQKSLDWNKLTFGDMIDPRYGFIYNTQETPGPNTVGNVDFSAGILGFSKRFYGGFAAHHLNQPDESFLSPGGRLPMKFTGHAGAIIPLERNVEDASISPNILFKKQQDFVQLNLGLYVTKGPIVGGFWFRKDDSFIVLLGFQAGLAKFGYSYDVTVSKLGLRQPKGSHEISFALQFDCKPKKRKFRTISCPSF
jgi:type IX secretion system PorP/SprF family membrane protein